MAQFTEKNELSSMMDSKEIPLSELNCKNSVANSVHTILKHHDGENSDCSLRKDQTMQMPISKPLFDKSSDRAALDPALLTVTSLESYSDVSSCSETDFGHVLNVLEKNPDYCSEFKDAKISKDKIKCCKNAQAESVKATENQDCVYRASSDIGGKRRCDSVIVMEDNNRVERSISNLDYQHSNIKTRIGENECHLKTEKLGCINQNTDCGVTKISKNCKDLGATLSIKDDEKNAIGTKSPTVQNDCQLKGINTTYEVKNNTSEDESKHVNTAQPQYDGAISSQEVEHGSFDFLQSCFGLNNTNLNQNAAGISFSGRMTKHFQNYEVNQTKPPVLVKATLESVPTGLLQETTDGGLLKPLMRGIYSSSTVSQDLQQQDNSIKEQIIKGLTEPKSTYDADTKNRAVLLSSRKLMKKLQPVILVKTAKQNVKDRNVYICSLCQSNMQTLDELIEHHHCKHSKHTFQYCLTCGTYFSTETVAEQHLCEKNEMQLADTVLPNPKQQSERVHAKFLCKFCQKPFIKRSYYQDHEQRHITVTKHRCDCCGLYFPNANKLMCHKRKVRCLPLILGPSKQRKTNSETDPKSPTKPTLTIKVDGCQIGILDCFVKLVDIKRLSPQKICCSLCGKTFKLRAQLKVHLKSHTDSKPFKCDKCKKVFKYSWNLDKHKKELCSGGTTKHITQPSTTGDFPRKFVCPTCPQTFRYSYNRIRHMRHRCLSEYMKMGKGKVGNFYKCPMCPKTFSQVSYRNRHIKKSCFERYKLLRKSSLKLEERSFNEEKEEKQELPTDYLPSYKCKVCPATFAFKSGVYRHMKKHSLLQRSTVQVDKHDNPADVNDPGSKNEAPQTCSSPNSTNVTNPDTICHFCDKSFTSSKLLKNHLRLHVGKKPFHCLECGRNFGRRGHLLAHKNVHKRKIQCSVCKIIVPTLGDLLKHRQSHVKKGMLKCPDCPMQFKFPVFLLRHVTTHAKKKVIPKSSSNKTSTVKQEEINNESSFKCGICQTTFIDSKAMSEHCLTHLPKPSICKCPVCNRNFTCRTGLIRHLRLHTGEKPFPCKTCGKRFHRKEHLVLHEVKCEESEEKPFSFTSDTAQQECKVRAVSKPDKIPKKFSCSYCPHIFTMSGNLVMHERAHLANNLLPCLKCGKYYKRNKICGHRKRCNVKESTSGVTSNSEKSGNASECKSTNSVVTNRTCRISNAIKTNIKDSFKERCPHCSKRFQFRSYLLRHLSTHFGKQQFACKRCNQKYDDERSCQQHEASCDGVLQQHESEGLNEPKKDIIIPDAQSAAGLKECTVIKGENKEQLKCDFCTKTFTKLKYLRRHILSHTEVKPYSCKACENSFSRYDCLMYHQARCRGKKQQLGEEQSIKVEHSVGLQADVLECNICLKKFSSHSNLTRHFSIKHSTVKPFSCKICGTGFTSKDSLKRHSVRVKCKMSSKCLEPAQSPTNVSLQSCRDSKQNSKLLQRIEGHYSNKWKFPCEYCPRRFKIQAQLIVHTRLHTGEKPFGCASCDERFIRSDYLKRHLSKCSGKRQSAKVLCDQCGGLFTQEALEIHQNNCIISLKSTDNPENKSSISSPSNVKVFSCIYCNGRFLLFSQLQQHILTHHRSESLQQSDTLEQEPLSCNLAIKEEPLEDNFAESLQSSPQIYGSNSHKNTDNTTMYPLSCQKCNKGFRNKIVQEKHMRICKGLEVTQKECSTKDFISSELECTPNDEVIVFDKGSNTTGTGVLQTKFSCKDQDKGNACKGNTVVNKYQCSECEQSFTDGLMLISHLEAHGREDQERRLGKSHRCDICGKTFEQAGVLQRHVKIQHQETLKNTCPKCFKNFRFPSDLETHRACHDPNRPFVCSTCKLRFWTAKSLHSHQRLAHPVSEPINTLEPTIKTDTLTPKIFACHPCNKFYTIKKSYMEHLRLKHRNSSSLNGIKSATIEQESRNNELDGNDADEKDVSDDDSDSAPYFPCHVCGKTFLTSESLEDHQRCHLGEKPFECEECGKCFIQLGNLQQHQRSHKSEFQCQMCGKGFVSLFALRKHKHTHLKKRPHRCTKCHLSFTRSSELAEHMITHRDENFPCDLCHEIFSCKSSRAEHRKIHTEAEEELPPLIPPKSPPVSISPSVGTVQQYKYRCEICQVRFPDPEQLSEHGCSPAKERPYSCKDCNKHFLHGSHLKKHQLTHQLSGTQSFQCNSCHMSFRHRHHFLTHLQTHGGGEDDTNSQTNDIDDLNQDKIYRCPICPESFSQVLELANHLSVHANMCNVCNKTFSTKQQLEKHEQCHLSAATQYECTECGKSFLGSDSFRQHSCVHQKHLLSSFSSTANKRRCLEPYSELPTNNEEEEVDVGEDFYKCPTCNKRFPSNITLKEHEKLHEIDRPFKCLICGKSFAKKKYLTRHQRIHQTSSYQCDLCPKSFKTEQSLLVHHKAHNEDCNYRCSICDKSYKTPYDLSTHEQRHPELQNFTRVTGNHRCDMCYKSFGLLSQLRKHQETHVGQVVYECTECDKAFAFLHLLEEHQQTHKTLTDSSQCQSSSGILFQSPVIE